MLMSSDPNNEQNGGTLFSNHNQPLLNRDLNSGLRSSSILANRDSNIDNIDRDRHDDSVQKKLSYRFFLYMGLILLAQILNTFFVLYHVFDSKGSESTIRYKLGQIFYMIFFFMQSLMLVCTLIWAYYLYVRLTLFLKPEESDDDKYEILRSSFEEKRAILRRGYN